ncbi:MAG: PTS sugar transporter subunit IIA, partial [Candidatus Omnitrophica bacterium]|nr:PTS sugar transporter subunit IIA [Candidatus Omnitrophota bacterium]
KEGAIIPDLKSTDKEGVIKELVVLLEEGGEVTDKEEIVKIILEREELGSTGIGQGIAVPHAKADQVKQIIIAFGLSRKGVSFESLDEEPVYLIFLVLAPIEATGMHLKALAKIARLLKDKVFRNSLKSCKGRAKEIFQVIKEEDEKTP